MPHCLSPASRLPLIGKLRRHPRSHESRNERPRTMPICSPLSAYTSSCVSQFQRVSNPPSMTIHDLDSDSLLHIFSLFRPTMFKLGEFKANVWDWDDHRWWYKLVQVCQRWRHLILGSASYLRLCLVCTPGTPVAHMLAHSPPFPLILGLYQPIHPLSAEDEEGIMLALRHRDRVRFIHINVTIPSLNKLLPALDNEFPALEDLHIAAPATHDTHLTLHPTFQAPHLRNLWLCHFASPIGSALLSSAIGLVTVTFEWIQPSTSPRPNHFLQLLSLLPHLERIYLSFHSSVPSRDVESQMSQDPITIQVINPNLHLFDFKGDSSFMEVILPHMAAPLLETFRVQFFNQLRFSVPHLANFITKTEKLRSRRVKFIFHHEAVVLFGPASAPLSNLELTVSCQHLDWQVSSATQFSNVLRPLLSDVVDLTLDYRDHTLSSESHNQADHTQWRKLLGSFRNVKTLRVHDGLVGEVSRSLILDGEPPLEILPDLKELICSTRSIDDKRFASFIHEREVAGRPISLIGETFPVGRTRYKFHASAGSIYIGPD